jgi:RNA polymerase sigma factor (sigma-70 family)
MAAFTFATMPTSGNDAVSAALESTLATYGALVRRIGWQHRLSDADVDELLQDVRLRLWRARGDSEQIREVSSSYMYRTAVSAALDLLRRRRAKRTEPLDEVPGEAEAVAAPSSDPTADLAESELAEQVTQVVDTIAPARRPVVRMYLAGYPREEIAELLGWTEAKTRNLLYRGLADLREGLLARGIGWDASGDSRDHDRTATT